MEHDMCSLIWETNLSETFVIIRSELIWTKTYIDLHVKYPLCLSDFNETIIFSTDQM
jgi:hypothetical protein